MLTAIYLSPRAVLVHGRKANMLQNYVKFPETFGEITHFPRQLGVCNVHASQTTHDLIAADATIVRLTPVYAGKVEMTAGLNQLVSTLPNLAALKVALEAKGFNLAWLSGTNTIREALRYIMLIYIIGQIMSGERQTDALNFIMVNLDATVNSLPLAVRTQAWNWMQSKGLAIGWIGPATTVREVLHFITVNLGIGKIILHEEEFA